MVEGAKARLKHNQVRGDNKERMEGGGGGRRLISDKRSGEQRLSGVFITAATLIVVAPR